jgi:hypothetical protein
MPRALNKKCLLGMPRRYKDKRKYHQNWPDLGQTGTHSFCFIDLILTNASQTNTNLKKEKKNNKFYNILELYAKPT